MGRSPCGDTGRVEVGHETSDRVQDRVNHSSQKQIFVEGSAALFQSKTKLDKKKENEGGVFEVWIFMYWFWFYVFVSVSLKK